MPKLPIAGPVRVTRDGVQGDRQRDRRYHGGLARAICLYSEELYAWLRDEHAIDLRNGSVGENFTTRGIDIGALDVGAQLQIGSDVIIQLTDVRVPCRNLNQWDARLLKVIQGHSGWV